MIIVQDLFALDSNFMCESLCYLLLFHVKITEAINKKKDYKNLLLGCMLFLL